MINTIFNVRRPGRNIRIEDDHVFVNNVEVFGDEAKQVRGEMAGKVNSTASRIATKLPQTQRPKTGGMVVIQQAGQIVHIHGDVTIDASGRMTIRSRSKK